MPSAQQKGRDFEAEFAREMGLEKVVASGALWFSKLDVKGSGARWSLKFTEGEKFTIDRELLSEAIIATEGVGGDGSTPLWAIRIEGLDADLVLIRKEDFKRMQAGDLSVLPPSDRPSRLRRARAAVPSLLRGEE